MTAPNDINAVDRTNNYGKFPIYLRDQEFRHLPGDHRPHHRVLTRQRGSHRNRCCGSLFRSVKMGPIHLS